MYSAHFSSSLFPAAPGSWQPPFYSQLLWLKSFGLSIGVKSCSTCLSELGLFHLLWWCPSLPTLLRMTASHWIFMAEIVLQSSTSKISSQMRVARGTGLWVQHEVVRIRCSAVSVSRVVAIPQGYSQSSHRFLAWKCARYVFLSCVWDLNSIWKWSVTPMVFVPLLLQWVCLARLFIVATFRVHS